MILSSAELTFVGIVHPHQVLDLIERALGQGSGALVDQDGRPWHALADIPRLRAQLPPGAENGPYHVLAADNVLLFAHQPSRQPRGSSTALFVARHWRRRSEP